MSIIEQAARRLEELRRSGIELPGQVPIPVGDAPSGADRLPARLARRLEKEPPATFYATRRVDPDRVAPGTRSKPVDIDLMRLSAMGYLTPDRPRSQIADEFRLIKRQLLLPLQSRAESPVQRANLIMVTSALPGEGKTFVSINLAISLAMELGRTVLLVDADVARPSVLSRLALAQAAGLLDVLAGPSVQPADVMLRTNIDNLTILPAGTPRGQATELLASDAMNRLLDELASRFADRVLIFDAPPLLPSTESRVLATHMGQIVVVVEADRTGHKSVAQALATVQACPVVLPLLNKISRSEVGSYYGYYGPTDK